MAYGATWLRRKLSSMIPKGAVVLLASHDKGLPLLGGPLPDISTGMHASIDVQRSLLNSVADRTNMVKTFINGTLSSEESKSFYCPIPR